MVAEQAGRCSLQPAMRHAQKACILSMGADLPSALAGQVKHNGGRCYGLAGPRGALDEGQGGLQGCLDRCRLRGVQLWQARHRALLGHHSMQRLRLHLMPQEPAYATGLQHSPHMTSMSVAETSARPQPSISMSVLSNTAVQAGQLTESSICDASYYRLRCVFPLHVDQLIAAGLRSSEKHKHAAGALVVQVARHRGLVHCKGPQGCLHAVKGHALPDVLHRPVHSGLSGHLQASQSCHRNGLQTLDWLSQPPST